MGVWDDVDVGVGGDETGNFGPRQETGCQLYQVDTNALVSAREQVDTNPIVKCHATEDRVLLSANNDLSIFAESCHELENSLTFESKIEQLGMTDDGNFAAVGEHFGSLHFIDCDTQQVLFKRNLLGESKPEEKRTYQLISFTPLSGDGICSLVVVLQGHMHVFRGLNIQALHQALESKNWAAASEFQKNMQHSVVDLTLEHDADVTFALCGSFPWGQGLLTAGSGRKVLCAWQQTEGSFAVRSALQPVYSGMEIKKCAVTQCGRSLLVLDAKGTLSLWIATLLILVRQWDANVNDFQLLEAANATGFENTKLAVLSREENDDLPHTSVTVCELPSLSPVYSLKLGHYTHLATCPTTQEALYLIEGVRNDDPNCLEEPVNQLRMRCLTEALPESRYSRMLHKKQFSEAEEFAVTFKLDVELCHKVHSHHLIDKLSPWNADKLSEEDLIQNIDLLFQCLTLITDDDHVVDLSVKAALPSYQSTHKMLCLARGRLEDKVKEGMADMKSSFLLTQVMETLHRLSTFQMLYGIKNFSGDQWDIFRQANMLSVFLRFMAEGKLDQAFTVWRAHQCDFKEKYTTSAVKDVLASIPEDCLADEIRPWLAADLIPYTIRTLPDALPMVAMWIEQRTAKMELSEPDGWPQNALKFGQVFQSTCMSVAHSGRKHCHTLPDEFAFLGKHSNVKLHRLLGQLQALVRLHEKYNFQLGLMEFAQETVESLTFRMLDRVAAPEVVPATIQKVVRPYMTDHNLPQDFMLLKYIEDLLERCGKKKSFIGEAPWEAKARAVVGCIDNTEYKMKAILSIMTLASVPWSSDMQSLVDQTLSLNHPMVGKLKEGCRYVEMRKLLIQYGLREGRDYSIKEASKAERLVYFILNQDRSSAVQDALYIASVYKNVPEKTVYTFRLYYLAVRGRLQEISSLIKTLPVQMALSVGKSLVTRTAVELNSKRVYSSDNASDTKAKLTAAACHVLKLLLLMKEIDVNDEVELERDYQNLHSLHALQKEFGEFVSVIDFEKESFRKELLQKYLKMYYAKTPAGNINKMGDPDRKPSKKHGLDSLKLHRLAVLLDGDSHQLTEELALNAARTGDEKAAVELAKSLQLPDVERADTVYRVARALAREMCEREAGSYDDRLTQAVYELACFAATHCKQEKLAEYSSFSRLFGLVCRVSRQCESGDYITTSKGLMRGSGDTTVVDPFNSWTFSTVYKEEEGLVMDSNLLIPKACQYVEVCLPASGKKSGTSKHRCHDLSSLSALNKAGKAMIQLLSENSHCTLALYYAMNCHSVASIYVAQHHSPKQQGAASKDPQLTQEIQAASSVINNLNVSLVKKILRQSHIDQKLLLGCLCSLPKPMAYSLMCKLVESMGHNYKRVLCLGEVGFEYSGINNDTDNQQTSQNLALHARWGHRLSQYKISFKLAFNQMDMLLEKNKLLPKLTQCSSIDVDTIAQYCSDFNLDKEEALYMLLQHVLLPVKTETEQDTEEIESCLQQAHQVLQQIENPPVECFQSMLSNLNPYDYERIGFVLKALQQLDPLPETERMMLILDFIRCYKRLSSPSDYEIKLLTATQEEEEEEQFNLGNKKLSPLSKERLPFHPLCSPSQTLQIIAGELNASTVHIWLPAASTFKIVPDLLYITAVNNMVKKHVQQKSVVTDKSQCQWDEKTGVDTKLFNSISKVLMSITSAEDAIMCASYVVKVLPMGAEKVRALEYCKLLAEKWLKACPDASEEHSKAVKMYHRLSDLHRVLATEQVLYKNRLGEAELLALVKTPARLTFRLYEHISILERSTVADDVKHLPDIHRVCEEIARLCNLNLELVHQELVVKWLPSSLSGKQEDLDMTTTFNFGSMGNLDMTMSSDEDLVQDEQNLKKVMYILQYGPIDKSICFLLNYSSADSSSITNLCRSRALSCLFSLADTSTIEQVSNKSMTELSTLRQTLLYLVELEQLQMPRSLEDFAGCKKEGLVRSIWRNHSHKHGAVRFVADLCLEYKIFDPNLWNSILKQLLALQMMSYLREVLTRLSDEKELWQVPNLQEVWRNILLSPLTSAVPPLSPDQADECFQSYSLLFRCPVVFDMDLKLMIDHFIELDLQACAVGCTYLLPSLDDQRLSQQKTLSGDTCLSILQQLEDYSNRGYAVPLREQIVQTVYIYLHTSKLYHLLTSSSHLEDFVIFLINVQAIDHYLVHLLVNDKLADAIKFMELYNSVHQEASSSEQTAELEPVERLRFYLDAHGLLMEVQDHLPPVPREEPEAVTETGEEEEEYHPLRAPWEEHLM